MPTIEEVRENTLLVEDPVILKGALYGKDGYLGKIYSVSTVFIYTDKATYRYCFNDKLYSEAFSIGVEDFRLNTKG